VRHALAAILAVVDDQPVAAFVQPQFAGNLSGFEQEMTEKRLIFGFGLGNARDGLFGNDQNMLRRLGVNVANREYQIIFVNNGRVNFPRDDFLKKCFAHDLI
jgi:hypothetical protein